MSLPPSKLKLKADAAMKKKTPNGRRAVQMTPERWTMFIQRIANGATKKEACIAVVISLQTAQAFMIANPTAMEEYRAAEIAWIRRDWPHERIDEFLMHVASGMTGKAASEEMGFMEGELQQFMRIIFHDASIKSMYDRARELQCEAWADEIIDIADEGRDDTITMLSKSGVEYQKPNYEVLGRSKIKIEARQWLMKSLHKDRFGDRLQQEHSGELNVNHSEILDNARKRKEKAKTVKQQLGPKQVPSEDTPPAETMH